MASTSAIIVDSTELDYEPGSLCISYKGTLYHMSNPIPDDTEFCEIELDSSDLRAMWVTWIRCPTGDDSAASRGPLTGTLLGHSDEMLIRELKMQLSMDEVRMPRIVLDNSWISHKVAIAARTSRSA